MVKISLPIHDGVTEAQVLEFYAAHMPKGVKVSVEYRDGSALLTVPVAVAPSCNVLYYSIPDYLQCAC